MDCVEDRTFVAELWLVVFLRDEENPWLGETIVDNEADLGKGVPWSSSETSDTDLCIFEVEGSPRDDRG